MGQREQRIRPGGRARKWEIIALIAGASLGARLVWRERRHQPSPHAEDQAYASALKYDWLTPLYDPALKWLVGEETFKRDLVTQLAIERGHRVLDVVKTDPKVPDWPATSTDLARLLSAKSIQGGFWQRWKSKRGFCCAAQYWSWRHSPA